MNTYQAQKGRGGRMISTLCILLALFLAFAVLSSCGHAEGAASSLSEDTSEAGGAAESESALESASEAAPPVSAVSSGVSSESAEESPSAVESVDTFSVSGAVSASSSAPESQPDQDREEAFPGAWTITDGITVRLLQQAYPVGVKQMTLVLENRSDSVMSYGRGWFFEGKVDGKWEKLPVMENYGFTEEGYLLCEHDKNFLTITTDVLKFPLTAGTYRVTGRTVRVAPNEENIGYGMDYVEYPPFELEFTVSEAATAEPPPEEQGLMEWQLPEIESWRWYTPWACASMYDRSGMNAWQTLQGKNGLVAVLYREDTPENEMLNIGDRLMMDIFDRKTGKRYPVYTELTVESENIWPHEDGFKVDRDGVAYYCRLNSDGTVGITPM